MQLLNLDLGISVADVLNWCPLTSPLWSEQPFQDFIENDHLELKNWLNKQEIESIPYRSLLLFMSLLIKYKCDLTDVQRASLEAIDLKLPDDELREFLRLFNQTIWAFTGQQLASIHKRFYDDLCGKKEINLDYDYVRSKKSNLLARLMESLLKQHALVGQSDLPMSLSFKVHATILEKKDVSERTLNHYNVLHLLIAQEESGLAVQLLKSGFDSKQEAHFSMSGFNEYSNKNSTFEGWVSPLKLAQLRRFSCFL